MGVYIKGMKMPRTCRECAYCWAGLKSCDAKYGLAIGDRWDIERASFCPLTEVPEPHGRLIDADALMKPINESWRNAGLHTVDYGKIKRWINNAPTIIERSK